MDENRQDIYARSSQRRKNRAPILAQQKEQQGGRFLRSRQRLQKPAAPEELPTDMPEIPAEFLTAEPLPEAIPQVTPEAPAPEAAPEAPAPEAVPEPAETELPPKPQAKRPLWRRILTVVGRVLSFLLVTVLLIVIGLYALMYVLAKGPSPTARDIFVRSVRETSAMGFVANLYFSESEIQKITGSGQEPEYIQMDASLIALPEKDETPQNPNQGPQPDAWGMVDEDGDGIIVEEVRGEGYNGYMMVVLDPSRVIMGSVPEDFGRKGRTVADMVDHFNAVAGTNAGGFYDPGGTGNGSIPDTMVVYEGKVYYEGSGIRNGFAGFDSNHILHVGKFSAAQVRERDIQYGVCFGPVLVVNGQPVDQSALGSGVNPRTAIGQRSDGAVLLLVIDGRQVSSLGATYQDLVDVFLSYGAVNACNLDGGSSTMMWYQGDYINNCASVVGIRPVPTSFMVLEKGDGSE